MTGPRERVDVVVVGAGAVGLAVARALAAAGVERTVVLEKEPAVGQGSTARANGGVRAQFTTPINVAFSMYSIEEFERLQRDHGDLLSFHQVGYLFVTGTEEGEAGLRVAMDLQRSLRVDTEWLTLDEIGARAPLIRLDGLRGGTFHARDGFLDPHGAVQAFRTGCPPDRVDIRTGVDVTGLRPLAASIAVNTTAGDLEAGWDTSLDPRFLEDLGRLIGNRFPALRDVPIDARQCWAGLYPETPDHHAVVGPAEEQERLILSAGFGGHGLMHAPAAGQALAELITEG